MNDGSGDVPDSTPGEKYGAVTSGKSDGSEIVRRSVTTPGVGRVEMPSDEPVIVLVRRFGGGA